MTTTVVNETVVEMDPIENGIPVAAEPEPEIATRTRRRASRKDESMQHDTQPPEVQPAHVDPVTKAQNALRSHEQIKDDLVEAEVELTALLGKIQSALGYSPEVLHEIASAARTEVPPLQTSPRRALPQKDRPAPAKAQRGGKRGPRSEGATAKVFEYVQKHEWCTARAISDSLGMETTKVSQVLFQLGKQERIKHHGDRKSRTYAAKKSG